MAEAAAAETLVKVRPSRPTDRAGVARLGERLFRPFGDYASAMYRWVRHPDVSTIVAADGAALAGFAMVGPMAGLDDEIDAYLFGIAVDEDHRRSGLGVALLDAAIAEARRRGRRWGARRLRLDVARSNIAAVELFRRAGFTEHDAAPTDDYRSGEPALSMALALL